MTWPVILVRKGEKTAAHGGRLLVNMAHILSVEPAGIIDGNSCVVLLFLTGTLLIRGTLDDWMKPTWFPLESVKKVTP